MLKTLLFILSFNTSAHAALGYSKIEHAGCAENSYCSKETGILRTKWLDLIEGFSKDKISESELNRQLQKDGSIPFAIWAQEEASIQPKIMMWNSPCSQHRKEASTYYIADHFRADLKEETITNQKFLIFDKTYGAPSQGNRSFIIPRGETPLFIDKDGMYFLREDEGKYYGLSVGLKGQLKVSKIRNVSEKAREAVCPKELVDLHMRHSPHSNFYQSYSCREIWDQEQKKYQLFIFGWSCN